MLLYHKSNGCFWFCVSVVCLVPVPHINGINNNYIKMFPKIGENVTLKCGDNSMKNSNILWQMNHKELPGRAKVMENGDLFLSSFDTSDAGIYMCDLTAANSYVGHAPLTKFELKPKSVPGSMIDVNVIPYTVLMLITWKQIENNGGSPITNITIQYKDIDDKISNGKWIIVQVDPSKVQKEIYSLCPNTIYKIQIWASNEIGNGEKTELTTKTLSDMTETELEKHLLEGIDTFDTRAWTFAVIVIMSTFSIFGIALCCLFIKDHRMQKRKSIHIINFDFVHSFFSPKYHGLEDSEDVERIELIPNIIINPGYSET